MIDLWRIAYRVAIVVTASEFLFLTTLFLLLRPRVRMEWATLLATAGMFGVFGTLTWWHLVETHPGRQPAVYPPLVVAFWVSVFTLGHFTIVAWRDWLGRRR